MGGAFINPLRWLMGEDCSRMKGYIYVLRILEFLKNKSSLCLSNKMLYGPLYLFFYFWHKRQCYKYGVHIAPNKCDFGLRIVHPGGIHVNANHIGKFCTLTQGVVVGKKGTNENRPYIGDNVQLTLGCKVIGRVMVGNNTVVCPNSVVIKDLPDNVIASGVPISIIRERKEF